MPSPWIVPLESLARKRGADPSRAIGGKASGLAWLARHSFPVPEAWVLPADVFDAALRELPPGCEPRSLLRAASGRAGYSRAAEARHEILRAPLPRGVSEELAELWEREAKRSPWGLAVRSSATCEDGALVSMAGLAETRLGVRGARALEDAVRAVWASIASGRALAYLAAHGVRDVGMAVILQRVVEAEAAGVLFTRAHDGASEERVINAGFGLGSPVVDGVTTPDMLRLDAKGEVVEQVIARKTLATIVGPDGPTEVEVERPDAPALSPARVAALSDIAARLEALEPASWDVEFACDRDQTWLVQARPATGRGFPEGGDADTVWSSVNVGEALPGVATPLTWSVAGTFSESGFRRAFAALGCHVPRSARLVGNVYGRFYLNLTQFMRIAAQVPWLDPRALVDLGGGSGGEELSAQVADVSKRGFYARLPMTAARLVQEQWRLDDIVAAFEVDAEKAIRAHSSLDLAILPDEGLARTTHDILALLEKTGTVMLTAASSTLGTHLALTALLARHAPIGADRLAQGLTRGIRDLESARPAVGIARVVVLARGETEARAALEREGIGLDAIPEGPTKRAIQSFLELYGDRAVREAELATPRWAEDPRPVLTMIRAALRDGAREMDAERGLRGKEMAEAEMARLLPRLGLLEQTALRHVVGRAQKAARLRERMRAWVTRVLGILRGAMLDAERRLLRLMPELEVDARSASSPALAIPSVFFLTVDEVVQALRASRTDLAPLVRARRADYARDRARPDPPPTFTGAPPPVQLPPSGGDTWHGLAASAGVVEGLARVLLGPQEMGALEPGEILVVHTTDVGWTPMFLIAAGVVTELGGTLSHAAIVARELGVPSVVNVNGITRALKTGDRVRVDGDRGVIERLR